MRIPIRPTKSWVVCILAMSMLLAGCLLTNPFVPNQSVPGSTITVVLVRHAERDPGADPPLNAEGQKRAAALVSALSERGVTAVFSPDLLRNRQTAQPVADAVGVNVQLWTPAAFVNTTLFAEAVLADIRANHVGGTVLFVGNIGSTIPTPGILDELYRLLGGTGRAPNRYEDLYVAVIPAEGDARFVKATYGGKSSLDP